MSPLPGIIASQKSGHLTPAASLAYDSIQTVTLTSAQTSIAFSSFSSSYKHLQIRGVTSGSDNTNVRIRFNSDTGSNYAYHGMQAGAGYGTTVGSNYASSQTGIMAFDQQLGGSTYWNGTIIDILDYTNTNKAKTIRTMSGVDNGSGNGFAFLETGLWTSSSAITAITIYPYSNTFNTNSTFALYGIKG